MNPLRLEQRGYKHSQAGYCLQDNVH